MTSDHLHGAPAKSRALLSWIDNKSTNENIITRSIRSALRVLIICVREFNSNDLSLRSAALTYTILLSLVPMVAMGTAVVKGLGGGNELRELVYSYIDTLEATTHEFPFAHNNPDDQADSASQTDTPKTSELAETANDISAPLTTETDTPPADTTQQEKVSEVADDNLSNSSNVPAGSIPENQRSEIAQEKSEATGGLTDHLRSAVDQLFDYVDNTNFAAIGTFGVLGIILSILLVLNHIEMAMNTIWHVQEGRPLLRKISDYITLLILMPFSINIGFASTAVLSNQNLSDRLDILIPFMWMQALFFKLLPVFIIALTLYVLYIFFPNTKVKMIPALCGALVAATLWFIAQNAYIALQVGVSKYNAIYGSFATFPLFLIWIYFGWLFILAGAQIAYAVQKRNQYNLITPPSVPSMTLAAAFDILQEVYDGYNNEEKVDTNTLKDRLPNYTSRLLEDTLTTLTRGGLLLQPQTGGGYFPLKPEQNLERGMVIETVLGKEAPETTGGEESKKAVEKLSAAEEKGDGDRQKEQAATAPVTPSSEA